MTDHDGSVVVRESQVLRDAGAAAEIYVLAQNFLLYIALVIITALLQHYYFPDSIKRGQAARQRIRKEENDATVEEEEAGMSPVKVKKIPQEEREPMMTSCESTKEEELLSQPAKPSKVRRMSSITSVLAMDDNFDQNTESRQAVLTRLSVCIFGLLLSFLVW
eukprot:CAMPEP_0197314290 /NCGR_PEP_ID=MMETSP0891-20130614/33102_1 /TAXON_ID=44058 ORGANISM="Aureoumbra lagunensis, Strain CCMP1510" /NCGR_SAMPLE_ID=MMETSP0891 /ASSEMBLY_ACC=CAM_ASM_000534 /LENGTH=162 /DNA_ID=CAMNT_0042802667 /DNA_START=14 /DNA_END=499 /DNA_ORIENTATION=+